MTKLPGEDHCRLGDRGDCEHPHVQANLTDDPATAGTFVTSDIADVTAEGGEPRISISLAWWTEEDWARYPTPPGTPVADRPHPYHTHELELSGDGLRYLAELLARIYGVKLPSDVSDLLRDYHAGEPEQAERAWHELTRRGVDLPDWREDR